MSRELLTLWWERDCMRRREALVKQTPLPSDGASWVVMVNFFGVVGMADARIKVSYIDPLKVMNKMLEVWPKRETWFNAKPNNPTLV